MQSPGITHSFSQPEVLQKAKSWVKAARHKRRGQSFAVLDLSNEETTGFHFSDFRIPKWELDKSAADRCGSAFVLRKGHRFRLAWTLFVIILLIYTGTIFMYRVCFVTFRIETEGTAYNGIRVSKHDGWEVFETLVTVFFGIDLVLNFFFTYENQAGNEVVSLRLIATQYLKFDFWLNLFGSMPEAFVALIVQAFYSDDAPAAITQGMRIARLQRVPRLTRIMRLFRLGKLLQVRNSKWVKAMERQRSFRLLNLVLALMLVVHMLACGWYLCAALHDDPQLTWVARRSIDGAGEVQLMEAPPFDTWAHAMYFILTVFTTVGFGDMSAVTIGEIFYVCWVMGIGAVVHSIIVGEVISLVTQNDKTNQYVDNQVELIEAFAEHAELDKHAHHDIRNWVTSSARVWASHRFDKQEMKDILTSKCMPRPLLGRLPSALFDGKLLENGFLHLHRTGINIPPRLPILVALNAHKTFFKAGDLVYQTQDFPFNIFLVLSGTFAFVSYPSSLGGVPYSGAAPDRESAESQVTVRFSGREESNEGPIVDDKLSPYQTFSYGAYFGDIEMFRGTQRKTAARCEADGHVLVVRKDDVQQLSAEFPQFFTKWVSAASHREAVRAEMQTRLTEAQDYKEHASRTITRELRRLSQARRKGGDPSPLIKQWSAKRSRAVDPKSSAEMNALWQEMQAMNQRFDTLVSALKANNDCKVARI